MLIPPTKKPGSVVALRKESVDRNYRAIFPEGSLQRSLSARRAWIEIFAQDKVKGYLDVALRKESVDRNIRLAVKVLCRIDVALRKESVDRNKLGF